MWKCPKCNREFKKTNQSHFCSSVGETIESYIASIDEHQEILLNFHQIISDAIPEVTQKLSCKMPTFWQGKNIIQYAAHKNHLGFYPFEEAVNNFTNQITKAGYTYNKGCIQIPGNTKIDDKLITEIVKYRLELVKKELNK